MTPIGQPTHGFYKIADILLFLDILDGIATFTTGPTFPTPTFFGGKNMKGGFILTTVKGAGPAVFALTTFGSQGGIFPDQLG